MIMKTDSNSKSLTPGIPESYGDASLRSLGSSQTITPELLSLVKRIAVHLKGRLPKSVEVDDLMQSGFEGLVQAMSSYDKARNISLEQFAKTRIRGAMLDDVRRMSQTTRTTISFKREHASAIEKLTIRFGREPTGKEVASYLGKDVDTYQKERLIVAGATTSTNDAGVMADDFDNKDEVEQSPEDSLEKAELLAALKASIEDLPERTQLVLSLYYHDELNLKEIAAVIDVTESRVSQILSETASKLRKKVVRG